MRETESIWDVMDIQMLVFFLLCVISSSAGKFGENRRKVIILFFKSSSPPQSRQLLNWTAFRWRFAFTVVCLVLNIDSDVRTDSSNQPLLTKVTKAWIDPTNKYLMRARLCAGGWGGHGDDFCVSGTDNSVGMGTWGGMVKGGMIKQAWVSLYYLRLAE